MTRKLALQEAIQIIEAARIGKQRKADILAGLQLCMDELPFAKWTEAAIFDACDQFVLEHGFIKLNDFDYAGLPSHPTIKNRFGMTAKEFRDKYYPLPALKELRPKYSLENVNRWNAKFIDEFHRIRCSSGQKYNACRNRELPVWQTIARLNRLNTWTQLLKALDLSVYKPKKASLTARIEFPED